MVPTYRLTRLPLDFHASWREIYSDRSALICEEDYEKIPQTVPLPVRYPQEVEYSGNFPETCGD